MRKLAYGSVYLKSEYCETCDQESFVVDGHLVCCGKQCYEKATRWKRMSQAPGRKKIPQAVLDATLLSQGGLCIYCDIAFETKEYRNGKDAKKTIHIDHGEPFSYAGDNTANNLVASCSICNQIKADFLFDTLDEAKAYVQLKRSAKGYTFTKPKCLLSELRDVVPTKTYVAEILHPEMPMGTVGKRTP